MLILFLPNQGNAKNKNKRNKTTEISMQAVPVLGSNYKAELVQMD